MEIKGYILVNEDKVRRAIFGTMNKYSEMAGGVGEDASDELKLAAYDRIGGLIRNKDGEKVKNGCFCDYNESRKKRTAVPVKEPKVILEFRVGDQIVEVPENEEVPMDVKVAKMAEEQRKQK